MQPDFVSPGDATSARKFSKEKSLGMSTGRTEMLPHLKVTTGRNGLFVGKAFFPLLDWDLSGTTYRPGLTEDDSYIYLEAHSSPRDCTPSTSM